MPNAQSVPLRPVRSASSSSASAASFGSLLRAAASTSSINAQPNRPRSSYSAGALGRSERLLVATETVVEHRGRVLGKGDRPALAPAGRVFAARLDQLQRLRFLAAPGSEHQRGVGEGRVAGRLRDRIRLLDQRRSGGELSGVHVHARAIGGRERQHDERTLIASMLELARGQLMPRLVVPQIGGDAACQPEPVELVVGVPTVAGHGVQRLSQRGRPGLVAVGEASCESVQEEVDYSFGLWSGGRGAGFHCHFKHATTAAEATGEDRGYERFEIRLARELDVQRFKAFRRSEQSRRSVAPMSRGEDEPRA